MQKNTFVVKTDGTITPYNMLLQSRPTYIKTNLFSKQFGGFYLTHSDSYHITDSKEAVRNKKNINTFATKIATHLDSSSNWLFVGDCYFVFDDEHYMTVADLQRYNRPCKNTNLIW